MKCPKCQSENPDDAQFCIECGNPMEFHCPKCGAITPPTGKFCKACGHNLSLPSEPPPKELTFDEKLDKIQRYLPKGLTEKSYPRGTRSKENASRLQSCSATWRGLHHSLRSLVLRRLTTSWTRFTNFSPTRPTIMKARSTR
ncbi:MAG: zinc ribbon domain-containing protein [Deltaproteobacteria bacterium]|nr:zinc ribbon domain-containing protein [Deltaproteobacteria bacterium]